MSFGTIIKLIRTQRGLSRKQLAMMCERRGSPLHENTIYRIECEKGNTTMESIEIVCKVLGIELEAKPGKVTR